MKIEKILKETSISEVANFKNIKFEELENAQIEFAVKMLKEYENLRLVNIGANPLPTIISNLKSLKNE